MTMLSHQQILDAIDAGEICVEPFVPELVKRNSILLRLGTEFRRLSDERMIDIGDPSTMEWARGKPFSAHQVDINCTSLILASSLERLSLAPDLVGVLSGISNVARLGVLVHATSAYVNAGFGFGAPSTVVFELATIGGRSVRLRSGIPLCHLAIVRLSESVRFKHPSARTGQDTPGSSDLFEQFGHYILDPDEPTSSDA